MDSDEVLGIIKFSLLVGALIFVGSMFVSGGEDAAPSVDSVYEEPTTPDLANVAPAQSDWSWSNCTEARSAGAAPVYASEAGYGGHLDRDGDGVGCE